MRARDVMSSDVVTVRENVSLLDAVKLLINAGASALPVVDARNGVVGILSEHDVIEHILEGDGAFDLQAHLEAHGALPEVYRRALAGPVASLMTRPAISVTEDTRLKEIADLMVKHRVHNVPVIRDGVVAGMVNRVALVKALLSRPDSTTATGGAATGTLEVDDEQLRHDVVAAVRRLGLPLGGGFDVVARHGVVHLWGSAHNEEDHRAFFAVSAKVRGVSDVHSHMQVMPPRVGGLVR
ncbi:MAG: CBS domain-containing protein [Reyranella sp.]|nr:CBS domain-containing protein [Reyranella sp.]